MTDFLQTRQMKNSADYLPLSYLPNTSRQGHSCEPRITPMAKEEVHHETILWTRGQPVWPRQPNIGIIRSLARHHLATELPSPLDDTLLKVSFFDEGGFNKLYEICYAGHDASYLLRVTVPIEPYYKTESEVATIAYLRANTTIPVPRVLAWNSSRDNELTFEWVLMEKMGGVSLFDVWRKMPWERKLELTKAIAGMVKQLRDQKFDRIGGLYFESAVHHQTTKIKKAAKPKTTRRVLPVDEPQDELVDEPTHGPVDEAVDEQMDEPIDELLLELVNALIDEVVSESVDEPLVAGREAGYDAANMKASDTAIPSALQRLPLDVRSIADAQSPTVGLQYIVNDAPNEVKQIVSNDSAEPDGVHEAGATGTSTVEPFRRSEKEKPTGSVGQADFIVGRMFDPLFYVGNRPYLSANRGPYRTSLEWLSALVCVQLEWIKNGPIEGDEEYGEDFEEDFPMIERLCKGFLNILPTICSDEEGPDSFCLHHSDLNAANILVDPDTFEITGIVDWEFINVVPVWRAFEHPVFLVNIEPMSEEEPPIPVYEDNEDEIAVYERDQWDERILRRHFDQTMDLLTQGDRICIDDAMKMKAKRDCREYIPALTDVWNWSKIWLKTYKTTGVSKNGNERSKESCVYEESNGDIEDYTWLDSTQS